MIPPVVCPTCGQTVTTAERRIRNAIKEALAVNGWTQVQLAEASGFTQKHISQLLNGKCGISLDIAEQLLGLLGATLVITTSIPAGAGQEGTIAITDDPASGSPRGIPAADAIGC